ncbi:thiamine phosphate synthase [Ancylobacter sp. FA202]|uniref:thiamine phosphate synthase n=1 Tax=Ancylobacter sp. FA202 TaxID=1111106 RepID=UPI00037DFD42|nr:thiamine phosphate synthase [Ancylobacter sp. FA202]
MARSSSRSDSTPARPAPRLYVLVPSLADPAGIAAQAEALRQAAQEVDIAAVLLRPLDGAAAQAMGPLLDACHAIGAAGLLEGNVALVATLGADGAHFDDASALKSAAPTLRPDGIAGAGALRTKHDAMTAAENGADYVMFGEPDAEGRRPPFEATLERIDWWAQVFEPPCVGYARTLDEVTALVAAGADFVAVDTLVFEAPRDGARALAERLAAIGDAS